ncbi:galactokinase family protein [Cutibacterium sp.]|uniref:galactokinase family protein n=1 Tax=Cutibacterium sp. TaxID=1912221 RepID=UPI0026DD98E8|nr:galactokinase family protein [Cutibacterium sp.]MDO4412510.1 galactokinase family protein [Cutibacterium sp.]
MTRWFVPGRIEVLGKHTDYAGGSTLVAAVDRGVTISVEPGDVGLTATTDASPGELSLKAGCDPKLPAGHWGRYAQAVLDRLTANFGDLAPARIELTSDLPLASGMSSSSALVSAIVLGLADFNGLPETTAWQENIGDDVDLAGYLACHENGMTFKNLAGAAGVGTFGGSEDHTAMVCSEDGQLGQFRFCPIRLERRVPFPEDMSFVVIVSGVAAEKTGAARDLYNAASLATREIVSRWNSTTGRHDAVIGDVLAVDPHAERLYEVVRDREDLTRRLDHFMTESEKIVPQASKALACSDLDGFGRAVQQSQCAAEELLGNQVPQTSALARIAQSLGAVGSTSFGAGFGGSVWALVPTAEATGFAEKWLAAYREEYPEEASQATTVVTRPGPPARRLD